MKKYFKHSCDPNVSLTFLDDKIIYYLLKPIKQGEQLYVSRVNNLIERKEARQEKLVDVGVVNCQCRRCDGNVASREQRLQITNNPLYQKHMKSIRWIMTNIKKLNVSLLMEDSMTLLRTYGRFDWCEEIKRITCLFAQIYEIRLFADWEHPLTRGRLQKCFFSY